MRYLIMLLCCALPLLFAAGCATDESKIDGVKKTVIPDCKGKTMNDLVNGLLQEPSWGIDKAQDGKESVTVRGTLYGDKLPDWVRQQKIVNLTFTFPLDAKTHAYDTSRLDGFPSFAPEGLLQVQRIMICE